MKFYKIGHRTLLYMLTVQDWTSRGDELTYRKSTNENPERSKSDVFKIDTLITATKMLSI